MAENKQDGNGESIDAKAQGLVNAYSFLYHAIGSRGRRIDPANLRKLFHLIVSDGFKPVMHDRQPHFTPQAIARICEEYGLQYNNRPRPVHPYGGATECSEGAYPVHLF